MKGFFHKSELLAMGGRPATLAPRCEKCRLYKGCISPKMPVTGEGKLGVLVVAEAPGKTEDERNVQLIGKAGQKVRETLDLIDVDLDRDCWKTNAIICRPPGNRTPTDDELSHCRPHLVETIETYKPHTIIALGDTALRQVINPYWQEDFGIGLRWIGHHIPLQPLNTWVCPARHPSYINRVINDKALGAIFALEFKQHLEAAFRHDSRPWKEVPDYGKMVEQVQDAAPILKEMSDYVGMAAFDYETNMLKPDSEEAMPVSASITWGRGKAQRCIAYVLTPRNKEVTRRFLRSPIPKIAANMKFEERWSMKHFDTRMRNWFWDTMQCAHVLDNRPKVSSNDFQAFVRLGLPTYSQHIKPFLKSKKGQTMNEILEEISVKQLLHYNGLDTVTEFEIAVRQMKELGEKPPWR